MIIEIGKYRIAPSEGHRDWSIYEYREIKTMRGENKGQTRTDWVHTGKYPATLDLALLIVYELNLKAEKPSEIIGLTDAIKEARAIKREILTVVENLGDL